MNEQKFKQAYNASRNGANHFVRHPLVRKFHYSDGVQECAEAGCYWLLDMLATEITAKNFKAKDSSTMCIIKINVKNGDGRIVGEFYDGDPKPYKKKMSTDLPDGEWVFYLSDDGDGVIRCILPSEY